MIASSFAASAAWPPPAPSAVRCATIPCVRTIGGATGVTDVMVGSTMDRRRPGDAVGRADPLRSPCTASTNSRPTSPPSPPVWVRLQRSLAGAWLRPDRRCRQRICRLDPRLPRPRRASSGKTVTGQAKGSRRGRRSPPDRGPHGHRAGQGAGAPHLRHGDQRDHRPARLGDRRRRRRRPGSAPRTSSGPRPSCSSGPPSSTSTAARSKPS